MHEGMIEIPSKFLSLQFKPVFHWVSIFARCEAKTQIWQRVWLEKSSLLRQQITLLNSLRVARTNSPGRKRALV